MRSTFCIYGPNNLNDLPPSAIAKSKRLKAYRNIWDLLASRDFCWGEGGSCKRLWVLLSFLHDVLCAVFVLENKYISRVAVSDGWMAPPLKCGHLAGGRRCIAGPTALPFDRL